jgi:hypothetical protein
MPWGSFFFGILLNKLNRVLSPNRGKKDVYILRAIRGLCVVDLNPSMGRFGVKKITVRV